jgi:AcrR family transcriptional regulator
MKNEPGIEKNPSTEEKIKEAARRVFTKKGYAATRTRDIAEESGFNLALINYYFRSKEKLFDIVMVEHLQTFIHSVMGIVNDRDTTLLQKMEILISHYIDILIKNPDIPLFVLSEINANPAKLISKLGFNKMQHDHIYIVKQWKELEASDNAPNINPIHIMMNVLSLTIFPFIASPLIRNRTGISIEEFNALMEERKKLIPVWVKAVISRSGVTLKS